LTSLVFLFSSKDFTSAQDFNIGSNDVQGLIDAINEATSSGQPATINLANNSEYVLSTINNSTFSNNGLPVIISDISINGNASKISRLNSAEPFRIFSIQSPGKLTLNNITISGGYSTDDNNGGGGIFNYSGTLVVNNSVISENSALIGGGAGIWSGNESYTKIFNSSILNNTGGSYLSIPKSISSGGAFVKRGSGSFEVIDSKILNNYAKTIGGAIYANSTGNINLINTEISDNSAENSGGAIYNYQGDITIDNCKFNNNKATVVGTSYG